MPIEQNNNNWFSPTAQEFPRQGFLVRFTASTCADFHKFNQEISGSLYNIDATIVLMTMVCKDGHYCSLQTSQLAKTASNISLLATGIAHFSTMKATGINAPYKLIPA